MNVFDVWHVFICWRAAFIWWQGKRRRRHLVLPVPDAFFHVENENRGQYSQSHLLDAVVFSYVCILKFLCQLHDCMRKVVYLTEKKNKNWQFWNFVAPTFTSPKGNTHCLLRENDLTHARILPSDIANRGVSAGLCWRGHQSSHICDGAIKLSHVRWMTDEWWGL